jgi:uncharacterized low-complexity protein
MPRTPKPKHSTPLALGFCVVGSLLPVTPVNAQHNPFVSTALSGGYMLAEQDVTPSGDGKCGEGKCGGKNAQEAVCGIYQVGSGHKDESKVKDGKCGGHKVVESLCGGDR